MDYPYPPGLLSFPSSADKPDELLAELHEAQIALAIAEHHIRLWRTNSVTGNRPFRQHHSCVAHEALYETGKTIDRVAETEDSGEWHATSVPAFRQMHMTMPTALEGATMSANETTTKKYTIGQPTPDNVVGEVPVLGAHRVTDPHDRPQRHRLTVTGMGHDHPGAPATSPEPTGQLGIAGRPHAGESDLADDDVSGGTRSYHPQ